MQLLDIVAVVSLVTSVCAIVVSFLVARRQNELATRDLTLTTYSNAIQEIIGLKDMFRERHEIYEQQLDLKPELRTFIPDSMDGCTFLTFTSSFWRLSYIHSVIIRWKELGLTKEESQSLENEIRTCVLLLPGFRQVYDSFIMKTNNHNPKFKAWLRAVYASGSTNTISAVKSGYEPTGAIHDHSIDRQTYHEASLTVK